MYICVLSVRCENPDKAGKNTWQECMIDNVLNERNILDNKKINNNDIATYRLSEQKLIYSCKGIGIRSKSGSE